MASQMPPTPAGPVNYLVELSRWVLDKCKPLLTHIRAIRPVHAVQFGNLLYFYFHVILVWLLSIGTGLRFEMPNERFYQALEPVKILDYPRRTKLTRPPGFFPRSTTSEISLDPENRGVPECIFAQKSSVRKAPSWLWSMNTTPWIKAWCHRIPGGRFLLERFNRFFEPACSMHVGEPCSLC